jgi:hypothetical protein
VGGEAEQEEEEGGGCGRHRHVDQLGPGGCGW